MMMMMMMMMVMIMMDARQLIDLHNTYDNA